MSHATYFSILATLFLPQNLKQTKIPRYVISDKKHHDNVKRKWIRQNRKWREGDGETVERNITGCQICQVDIFHCGSGNPINIHWIRTGSEPHWTIIHCIVLYKIIFQEKLIKIHKINSCFFWPRPSALT